MRRFVPRALVALLLAVPLVATGGTAQAAACSGSSGVTVIVQFPSSTVTGCAPGDPASGKAALKGAGFGVTYVNGQAFVCTINGQPGNAQCGHTPPTNAYWAYFHAKRGGSWTYSSSGAASYNPAPGSVEGWRFGNGAKPSTPPPAAAPKPKPKPAPKPSTKPTVASPTTAAGVSPSATGTAGAKAAKTKAAKVKAAETKAAKTKAAKTKAAKAKKSAAAKASVSVTPSPSAVVAAPLDQSGPEPDQGGGNVPWLWGLVGLAVVGGAAGAVTIARRH